MNQLVKPDRVDDIRSVPADAERSAEVFSPEFSPAVLNIVTYRFGATPEATRPDDMVRLPTAALLIQRRGQLYEHVVAGQRVSLPRIALLGPTSRAHIWETDPNTEFTLVNLAPGATQALLGIDPREVREQVQTLCGHALQDVLIEPGQGSAAALNARLCAMIGRQVSSDWHVRRARRALVSLKQEQFGSHVQSYANHFGVTPRTLQRVVNKAVGLTTKQVLAIQRIRRLVTLTGLGWTRSIADLAQEAGFYDQSHMRYDMERMRVGKVSQMVKGDHILAEL